MFYNIVPLPNFELENGRFRILIHANTHKQACICEIVIVRKFQILIIEHILHKIYSASSKAEQIELKFIYKFV